MAVIRRASPPMPGLTLPRVLRARPTIGVEAATAVAWGVLIAMLSGGWITHHAQMTPTSWWCMPIMEPGSAARGVGASVLAGLPMWTLMSAAMMLPAAIPATRHVALHSLGWRGQRAILEFLTIYLAIWLAFGAAALSVRALWATPPHVLLVAVLALAAAWQLTPQKLRMLNTCRGNSAIPPSWWRATAGVARFGIRNGGACLASCWAMMLVMAVATSGQLIWSIVITAAISTERLMRRPQRAIQCTAAMLAAVALDVALLAR